MRSASEDDLLERQSTLVVAPTYLVGKYWAYVHLNENVDLASNRGHKYLFGRYDRYIVVDCGNVDVRVIAVVIRSAEKYEAELRLLSAGAVFEE